MRITDDMIVRAPVHDVWAAIKDPGAHAAWHPFVTAIEGDHALGAARACSVLVGGRVGMTREHCVEAEDGRRIVWQIDDDTTGLSRMVSDWRAGFSLRPADGGTRVTAESVFSPAGVRVRLIGPIVKRKFHQTQRAILEALKEFAER